MTERGEGTGGGKGKSGRGKKGRERGRQAGKAYHESPEERSVKILSVVWNGASACYELNQSTSFRMCSLLVVE